VVVIIYAKMFMYKSKEYNGMDILDSIFGVIKDRCDELSD
jgi:hypothetical protein